MKETVNKLLSELKLTENPYLLNLDKGGFEKDDFIETQIQFYFAVVFFNRPMSALAAKIPRPDLRIEILRNIWEEHGEGDLTKAHGNSFLEFLVRIGNISLTDVQKRDLWPEVRIFNTCLSGACILDDYMVGVAMMGMIERMFCEISAMIARGVVKRKWMSENDLVHYNLHAELDIKHADDFFNVVRESYNKSEENKYHVDQGLKLGAAVFSNLYRDLYENRKRRSERVYLGPHSRAQGIS